MFGNNAMIDMLLENAESYRERRNILALTEAENNMISNVMISKLYRSAIDRSHIDFDDIPKSKGNITAYKGYKTMTETLKVVENIATKSNTKIPELAVVEKAISNIIGYRDLFEKGFRLDKEFIVLQYNVLVASCVNATTKILYSYVDYIKGVDKVEFTIINNKYDDGDLCIANLEQFNKLCASGEFSKTMNFILKNKAVGESAYLQEDFVGAAVVTTGIILALTIIIRGIRCGVFFFYNMRIGLSNYLNMQAMFLEINKDCVNAEASNVSPAKKKEILKRQEKMIKRLRILADKIAVNNKLAAKKATMDRASEDKGYKYENIKDEVTQNNMGNFQLL